ncbi:hypothetical protein ABRP93_11185 [Corynebacterium sp. KPL2850]|uniref:hypothetical protein n=1 Tax=Corynebacterium sp. KPL2850 TaxID=3158318 RepID=UPI0032EB4E29
MHNDPRKDIFNSIYPDVDPTQNFPLTIGERLSLALSVGVFMFGGVSGSLLIAGIGLTFVVACSLALARKTPRRIRAEARSRFPREPWAEQPSLLVPAVWAVIAVIAALAWWFTPVKYLAWSAGTMAVIAAVVTWFLPTLQRRRARAERAKQDA